MTGITLSAGGVVLTLDPDLQWTDEFDWFAIEQSAERGQTGALIIDAGERSGGRAITLAPPDDSAAWMPRSVVTQLQAWEADANLKLSLSLHGVVYSVGFRRWDGAPIEAQPVLFVTDPIPGGFGDHYLVTLRLVTL